MDVTLNLKSLQFENGLSEEEKECAFLRSRSSALAVCGCAHAGFLCRLVALARDKLNHLTNKSDLQPVKVGIIGGGHMGKQLALLLLAIPGFKPSNINMSTKRPDTLSDFSDRGVKCYFDNRRLATWADVIFLCVLPSHLRHVCDELHSQLPARCLVYSFTSAVQVHRLELLLGHTFILRPQYGFMTCDSGHLWLRYNQVAAALKDKEVLSASCPLSVTGGLSLDQRWVSAVLYTLLNMCTAEGLRADQTVQLLNELFQTTSPTVTLTCQSFVNSSWASKLNNSEEPFPWINLVDVQTKQSPLTSCLSGCKALQDCISVLLLSSCDFHCTAGSIKMENVEATSELQSRLSSLSVSSFSGIASKTCDSSPLDRLQSTDLSQPVIHSDNQSQMDDNSNTKGLQQPTKDEPGAEGDSVESSTAEKSSNPGETKALPPLQPANTWTTVALKELKAKLRQEKDSVVTVYRGDIMTVHVPTIPEAKRVCWEFATDGYDIGFGVYFDWSPVTTRAITVHISESSDDEDEDDELEAGPVVPGDVEKGSKTAANSNLGEILPVYRQDSHLAVQGGSHSFPGEGTYLLKFDNSYSLWRNKTLYYRVYYSV
ncbi:hypothetical protein PGIGA_G00017560 [Pangasianodon gigas]|uniref:Uncharacterized protein n=1 Tax=Pangasianodon gigas TaxID=30993 RepID=A0ACC5WUD2_PANGG|nr:hypothetical protein [Pangasianodon gigas]